MPTKKLRGGPVIFVDPQIARWRKLIKKKGILLGRKARLIKKSNVLRAIERKEIDPTKRNFFD